jgi:hypothetical protein
MGDGMSDSCFCSNGRDVECPRHGDEARRRRAERITQTPVTTQHVDDPKTLVLIELDKGLSGVRYRLAWEQPDGTLRIFWSGEAQHLWRTLSNVLVQETDLVYSKRPYSEVAELLRH